MRRTVVASVLERPRRLGTRPLLLRGEAASWPATRRWHDPSYLCEKAGKDRLVSVERSDDGRFSYASGHGRTTVPLGLMLEHFAHVTASPGNGPAQIYAAMLPIDELSPTLREDIEVPRQRPSTDPSVNLWLGLDASTPLHWDASDNLLVQVCGRKRVRLYAPGESRRLHPFRNSVDGPRNASQIVDIAAAEAAPERWPGFADAVWEEASLGTGDMLFIPAGWWHATTSERPDSHEPYNLSINFWWDGLERQHDISRSVVSL